MKLFCYTGTSELIVIRAGTPREAVNLFLERYPNHLGDNAKVAGAVGRSLPKTAEELATHFRELSPDGPAEIVEDFVGYDGGF